MNTRRYRAEANFLASLFMVMAFFAHAGARAEEPQSEGGTTDSAEPVVQKGKNCPKPPRPPGTGGAIKKVIETPSVTQTVYCLPGNAYTKKTPEKCDDSGGSEKPQPCNEKKGCEDVPGGKIRTSDLSSIDLVAKLAIENARKSADEVLNIIDLIVKVGGVLLVVLSAVFAVLGVKGFQDLRRMNKKRDALVLSIDKLDEARKDLEQKMIRDDQQILQFLPAFRDMILAETFPDDSEGRKSHLVAATGLLEGLTSKMKGGDNTVRGTILAHLAFAYKRLKKYEEAFQAAREAVELMPKAPSFSYNAACYACLSGRNDSALLYLKKAISLSSKYRDAAPRDADLKVLHDREDFKKALAT